MGDSMRASFLSNLFQVQLLLSLSFFHPLFLSTNFLISNFLSQVFQYPTLLADYEILWVSNNSLFSSFSKLKLSIKLKYFKIFHPLSKFSKPQTESGFQNIHFPPILNLSLQFSIFLTHQAQSRWKFPSTVSHPLSRIFHAVTLPLFLKFSEVSPISLSPFCRLCLSVREWF